MGFFLVELEVIFFGKEEEYVGANSKDEAELIATQKVLRKLQCPKENISVISCKKINHS